MPEIPTRKPTVAEAVDIVERQTMTREQKFAHIRYWKTLYGDEFANQVMDRLRANKKK